MKTTLLFILLISGILILTGCEQIQPQHNCICSKSSSITGGKITENKEVCTCYNTTEEREEAFCDLNKDLYGTDYERYEQDYERCMAESQRLDEK